MKEGPVKWELKSLLDRDTERGLIKISQDQCVRGIFSVLDLTGIIAKLPYSVMNEEVMPRGSEGDSQTTCPVSFS